MYHPNQMNQMQGQGMRPGQQPIQRPGMAMQPQQMYGGQMPMHSQRPMNMPHGQPQPMGMSHGQPQPMGMPHGQPPPGYQMPMQMQQPMGMPQQPQHQMMNPETGPQSMEHPFSPQDVKMIPTPQSQQLLTPQPMSQQPMSQQSMQQPLSQQPMSQQSMQQPLSQQPMSQQSMQQPMSQQSMQQPLSQQPMSQQSAQQPMSQQQPLSQQPLSQQPMSQQPPSNAPPTPATPQQAHSAAPHQTPMSVPQAGSAQPDGQAQPSSTSQISQQFPLAHTDPMAAARNMMLKDLRLSIMELNEAVFDVGKKFASQQESLEKKHNIAPASNSNPLSVNPQSVNPLSVNAPGSVKSVDEPKSHDVSAENPIQPAEQYKTAMNNFLSVCNNIEANLMLILETQRQYKKFELMSEIKTPGDIKEFPPHLQNFVESMNEDKGHIDDTINYISNLIEKVRSSERKKSGTSTGRLQQMDVSSSVVPNFSMQNYPELKGEYMDVDDPKDSSYNY